MEAIDEVLTLAGRRRDDVKSYVFAEGQVHVPPAVPSISVDHHHAHAATSFLTSPFSRAAVVVCDTHADREVSVWIGEGARLDDQGWQWQGQGFARLYSECAELFFSQHGQEHQLEALAHLAPGSRSDALSATFRYRDRSLQLDSHWRERIDSMLHGERGVREDGSASAAGSIQRRIGELLLEFLAEVRESLGVETICLGGGFFFNTYFTTLVHKSGMFQDVFVPINPGNAGLAVGAALLHAQEQCDETRPPVSPFLGPAYEAEAIKATLDGCKLSYAFLNESEVLDTAVDALVQGQLVGWFQGRMEWGHKALGHRSILADPQSPYVLDNLNCFLRKRARWRSFGVSVSEESVSDLLCGPSSSSFMEYEYSLRDDRLRHVVPGGATSIRVQTVPAELDLFSGLLKRMEQATGVGALVNTSFNGFHEPIACSPRDAIRVFYGSGLDMLVMGQFVLRK